MVYRTTFEADEDVANILTDGVTEHGMARAEAYVSGLLDLFALIGREPQLMRLRQEYMPAVRLRRYKAHVVIYRDDDGDALIVRVLHWRQNLADALN